MSKYDLGWDFDGTEIIHSAEVSQWKLNITNVINQTIIQGVDSPWGVKTGGTVASKPIIHNGVVYFGSCDHNFYALDVETGKELWRFGAGGIVSAWSRASVWGDRIIFTCFDGNVYCISLDGSTLYWKFGTDDKLACTPLVYNDMIIVGSKDSNLYAISADKGKEIWRVSLGQEIASHPIEHGGFIYIGSRGGIHKISKNGRILWSKPISGDVDASIGAIGENIFFGCVDGNIYCYSTNGERKWRFPTNSPIVSDVVVKDNRIFIGSFDQNYYSLNTEGKLLWRFTTNDIAYTCFLAGDCLYLPSFRNRLYCVKPNGKLVWDRSVEDISHVFADEKIILAASWNCKLIALSKNGKDLWEFHTSLGYPSDVEFTPPEKISFEVIHIPDEPETRRKVTEERQIDASYGDFKGNYIGGDMRDYIGTEVKDGLPGMAYKAGKKVYRK